MVNRSFSAKLGTILLNGVVAFFGVIIALPLVWMVSASFKPLNEIYRYPPTLIPRHFTWGNYERLFKDWPFWQWYVNSILVATTLTAAQLSKRKFQRAFNSFSDG